MGIYLGFNMVRGLPFQSWGKIVYCFVLLAGQAKYFSFD